jgi:hypothetical protein
MPALGRITDYLKGLVKPLPDQTLAKMGPPLMSTLPLSPTQGLSSYAAEETQALPGFTSHIAEPAMQESEAGRNILQRLLDEAMKPKGK